MTWADLQAEGAAALTKDPLAARRLGDAVTPDTIATLIYTSGTTGVPKGVMLTHANLVSNVRDALLNFEISTKDWAVSVLPLSHIFERMAGHYAAFGAGTTIAYAESIDTLVVNLGEIHPTIVMSEARAYAKIYARVIDAAVASGAAKRAIFYRARDIALRWARRGGRPAASPWLALQRPVRQAGLRRCARRRAGASASSSRAARPSPRRSRSSSSARASRCSRATG